MSPDTAYWLYRVARARNTAIRRADDIRTGRWEKMFHDWLKEKVDEFDGQRKTGEGPDCR